MSYEPHEEEFLADLYRFAWILLMRDDVVQRVVLDSLEEVHHQSSLSHEDAERAHARAFQVVRQRALKVPAASAPSANATSGWPGDILQSLAQVDSDAAIRALHRVAEPGRSALALVLLNAVDVESMEKILGLTVGQLADAVDAARGTMANNLQAGSTEVAA